MASIHNVTEALAKVRGMPVATVEAYARVMRKEGVLPESKRGGGATPATPEQAALVIAAVMRGSPSGAAENARQIGQLVPSDLGKSFEGILQTQLRVLDWHDGITFAQAVGWFIERFADGTIAKFAEINSSKPLTIRVDRYRPFAEISWHPPRWFVHEYIEAWKTAVEGFAGPPVRMDGTLSDAMSIRFASPLLHEVKLAYERGDTATNRDANNRYSILMQPFAGLDLWGSEHITARTVGALARLFRRDGFDLAGLPLDPDHPWNRDLPPDERAARIAEIEIYVADRAKNEMGERND